MANPTTLSRPKLIKFKVSNVNRGNKFQAWNVTQNERIRTDDAGNDLIVGTTGGTISTDWFSTANVGDKIIIEISGAGYGSGSVTITSESGSQNLGTITGGTTSLPAVNM